MGAFILHKYVYLFSIYVYLFAIENRGKIGVYDYFWMEIRRLTIRTQNRPIFQCFPVLIYGVNSAGFIIFLVCVRVQNLIEGGNFA